MYLTDGYKCDRVLKVVVDRKAEYPLSPRHTGDQRFISGALTALFWCVVM